MEEPPESYVVPTGSSHQWTIEKFLSYDNYAPGTSLDSPIFRTFCQDPTSAGHTVTLQWRLGVYPNGQLPQNQNDPKYLSICLESCNRFPVETKYTLSIVGINHFNNISKSNPAGKLFEPNGLASGWEFARKDAISTTSNGLLVEGKLTITCCIFDTKIPDSTEGESANLELATQAAGHSEAFNFFEQLMWSGDLGDVTFIIGQRKMRLHKHILSSVSPVFREMLRGRDADTPIRVDDVKVNIMIELLRYVYAKNVTAIEQIAVELFHAANKYGVEELSVLCEETLSSGINMATVFQLVQLAVQNKMNILRENVVSYIVSHLTDFITNPEFNDLEPDVKDELLNHIRAKSKERHGY